MLFEIATMGPGFAADEDPEHLGERLSLPPDLAAYAGTFGELAFPVLLALGLMGRLGAAGLFVVNLMAVLSYPQLFTFDCPAAVQSHFFWGAGLLALVAFGPGALSVDRLLTRRLGWTRQAA